MLRTFRSLAVLAAAFTGIVLPASIANATEAPANSGAIQLLPDLPGIYISPWGSAHLDFSDSTKAWLADQGITVGAVAPFTVTNNNVNDGLDTPIGSTAGDHLDAKGRIFYPGGMSFTFPDGTLIELKPTYIRVMPIPLWSAGIWVNGHEVVQEIECATTTPAEVFASGRPTLTGFKLDKVPFRTTADLSAMFEQLSGRPGPAVGEIFATLIPRFDYIPTS